MIHGTTPPRSVHAQYQGCLSQPNGLLNYLTHPTYGLSISALPMRLPKGIFRVLSKLTWQHLPPRWTVSRAC